MKFNNVISKCPAIKFAVNRIASDKGRIIILVVSIKTINGAKIIGVFKGIRCEIKFLKFLNIDNKIKNIQNGIANVNEKIMCLDDEKIYGNNLEKLFNKIIINKFKNINDGDLKLLFLYNIKISLFINLNILNINIFIRFGKIHIIFGINIIVNSVLIQFICKLKIVVDGSKILNKFIIIN